MSWMRHNMTLVTQCMWSFWGWDEQSTLKCIDLCFFIIIIVIIIIFNGGNPPVTNPHHYHYCQNPTMVGFWLVGICWGTIILIIMQKGWILVFWMPLRHNKPIWMPIWSNSHIIYATKLGTNKVLFSKLDFVYQPANKCIKDNSLRLCNIVKLVFFLD